MLRLRCTAGSGRDSGVGANRGGASRGGAGRGGASHGGVGRGGVGRGGAVLGSQEDPEPRADLEVLEVLEVPASPEPLAEGASPGVPAEAVSPVAREHLEAQGTPPVLEPAKVE